MKAHLPAVVALILAACATASPPVIDSRSAATFEQSYARLSASLTPEQRERLAMALFRIRTTGGTGGGATVAESKTQSLRADELRAQLNGLDYAGILHLAGLSK